VDPKGAIAAKAVKIGADACGGHKDRVLATWLNLATAWESTR